ncbi:UDP-4-amino-4,6-dideoxy-N-acetyl-beta-L-altrosamine N-acetyltransferase [Halomonas sp. M1]|uniref:UDP-4-amino-4, 6-dideoxy-N-acetyl-beta-L-altrosamine N-acetyltransferase n=1 Tax=Halomonas sp. M1 TaxID=3035470 RepID=UPI002486862B|nr:UDP-4-amino-4,6-dideoxy-N-acetyl-beta-L-altrosamine N-acetyltransferase [Halomonas sp. M1]WFE72442.1 UDP-4-amino-4,6-dideoxy-N-acetyl-beta-L-altrosamine N-acetyltransferase [Halomonas sp. M1]
MNTFASLAVTLRPVIESDLAIVRFWRNHPDVRSYMYTQHEISEAEHSAWFKRSQVNLFRHLLLAERDGQPFGFVNIEQVDVDAKRAEWGFYLAPESPKGSGQALGLAALTYAFGTLAQHKLCGEALASNQRSRRFHERLGFTAEAHLRDHHFDGHTYHDVIGYGLLRSEWQAHQGAYVL